MEIVFSTRNKGKIKEFRYLFKNIDIQVLSLDDIQFNREIPEDGKTYAENALKKAGEVSKFSGKIAMADDSGIEIRAYNNGPGVKSSRFLGKLSYEQRNKMISADVEGLTEIQRAVKYKCVIAICTPEGKSFICEGECEGSITGTPKGENGFGYDPIFYLPEYGKTFAELPAEIKNKISHRAKAFKKAKDVLMKLLGDQ